MLFRSIKAFRSEYNSILQDGRDARLLLNGLRWRTTTLPVEDMIRILGDRRLQFNPETKEFDYCVGQYWPTEYRAAACRFLRDCYQYIYWPQFKDNQAIKKQIVKEIGRGVANRWF